MEYDNAAKGPEGPDNFTKHRAGLFEVQDKIKALKKAEKKAKKSKNIEAYRECQTLRL
jgi:hypothetical protein